MAKFIKISNFTGTINFFLARKPATPKPTIAPSLVLRQQIENEEAGAWGGSWGASERKLEYFKENTRSIKEENYASIKEETCARIKEENYKSIKKEKYSAMADFLAK